MNESKINLIIWIICSIIEFASSQSDLLSIAVSPSNKITVGQSFTVTCTINNQQSSRAILWSRKVGDVKTYLGRDGSIDRNYLEFSRYKLYAGSRDGTKQTFSLQVSSSGTEDTAAYECALSQTDVVVSKNVAVCTDTSLYSCGCMLTYPLSPTCFEEPATVEGVQENKDRTIIGLCVLLAIVAIYAIVITVFLGRDYLTFFKNCDKQRLNQSPSPANPTRTEYIASETTILNDHNTSMDSQVQLDSTFNGRVPVEEENRPKPKQVGRQGERRKQAGRANEAYHRDEDLHNYEEVGGANPISQGVGYAPYPENNSTNHVLDTGARPKNNYNLPAPQPSTSASSSANRNPSGPPRSNRSANQNTYANSSSVAPPRYSSDHASFDNPPVYDQSNRQYGQPYEQQNERSNRYNGYRDQYNQQKDYSGGAYVDNSDTVV